MSAPLETPRLLLLPLSRDLMLQSLNGAAFEYGGYHFAPDWAGEAAAIFPIYLLNGGEHENVAGSFAVVERSSGEALGMLGTKHVPKAGRVEIGYGLTEAGRGQGYATEAVEALLRHLRGWPNVDTVLAETLRNNHASIRVLEKCGFVRVDKQRPEQEHGEEARLLSWALALPSKSLKSLKYLEVNL